MTALDVPRGTTPDPTFNGLVREGETLDKAYRRLEKRRDFTTLIETDDGQRFLAAAHRGRPTSSPTAQPSAVDAPSVANQLLDLPLDRIDIGTNVRVTLEELEELTASVREHGVLQPVKAIPVAGDRFLLVWGQRRVLAARAAGLDAIPAIVQRSADVVLDVGAMRATEQLVENLHRTDLNPIDRAVAMRQVVDSGMSQADLARSLGIAPSTVANDLRLLEAAPKVQDLIRAGKLSGGHAKAILGLSADDQVELAEKAVKNSMSAHALESEAKWAKESAGQRAKNREQLEKAAATAVAALKKAAKKDATVLVHDTVIGRVITAAGFTGVKTGLPYGSYDAVANAGECGCSAWLVEHWYGGEVKVRPACIDADHRKARNAKAEVERKRHAEQLKRDQAKAEAELETRRAPVARLVSAGDPFGQRLLLMALLGDWDDDFVDRILGKDRDTSRDLQDEDSTWKAIAAATDEQVAAEIGRKVAEELIDPWGRIDTALAAAIAERTQAVPA